MNQVLVTKEAGKIVLYGLSPGRRLFAKNFGARFGLDPTPDDVVAKVRELCDGMSADVAFDAAENRLGLTRR